MTLEPALHTARLELRPLALTDVDELWPHVSDPELPKLMTWSAHTDRTQTVDFVNAMLAGRERGTNYVWAMRLEGTFCGLVGLHDIVRTVLAWRMDRGALGYWCGKELRNRGLMTEAAREVIRFGFEELGLHKISVGCAKANEPSRRVIEKLGFRFVGEERDHFYRDGQWWDHLSYEMLTTERS